MTINKDYNSSDDEEWDMVPDAGVETAIAATTSNNSSAFTAEPDAIANQVEERLGHTRMPQPSAPPEDEVMGLAEQQAKLGITDDTPPEEILKLMDQSVTNETSPVEDTPLLSACSEQENEETTPFSESTAIIPETKQENDQRTNTSANPNIPSWLRGPVGAATKALQDVEQKHHLKQRTRQGLTTVGSSLRQVGSKIQKETEGIRSIVEQESQKISRSVQHKVEELDVKGRAKSATDTIQRSAKTVTDGVQHKVEELDVKGKARTATQTIHSGAKSAGEKAKEWNKDGMVTQFAAAAAVLGAGIFLASKGKPGAGAAVMATGGAAFMATEAANSARRYDQGLNEDLHMD